jgi:hypothetical protein
MLWLIQSWGQSPKIQDQKMLFQEKFGSFFANFCLKIHREQIFT